VAASLAAFGGVGVVGCFDCDWDSFTTQFESTAKLSFIELAVLFAADDCNTDQWEKTAKEAGMGYILFLIKQHGGLYLWDIITTYLKVAKAPLGRDVLAELKKSCNRCCIELSLHFSEGEWAWSNRLDGNHYQNNDGLESMNAEARPNRIRIREKAGQHECIYCNIFRVTRYHYEQVVSGYLDNSLFEKVLLKRFA
jgi:alpha-L-fucosidase